MPRHYRAAWRASASASAFARRSPTARSKVDCRFVAEPTLSTAAATARSSVAVQRGRRRMLSAAARSCGVSGRRCSGGRFGLPRRVAGGRVSLSRCIDYSFHVMGLSAAPRPRGRRAASPSVADDAVCNGLRRACPLDTPPQGGDGGDRCPSLPLSTFARARARIGRYGKSPTNRHHRHPRGSVASVTARHYGAAPRP